MAKDFQAVREALTRAVEALRAADVFYRRVSKDQSPDSIDFQMAQAGFIQHFEFTFELARNVIQRWMQVYAPKQEDVDLPVTRRDVFRFAARAGLIEHPEAWFAYADARNASSHTYNPKTAAEVRARGQQFIEDVEILARRAAGAE